MFELKPMRFFAVLLLVTLTAGVAVGCGSRLPSPQTAHKLVQKHFQKYGKKYKESDFGKYSLEKVEIVGVQEMQKNMANVEAYTYLGDGTVYWVGLTLQKKTFGWRSVAWETLGVRQR